MPLCTKMQAAVLNTLHPWYANNGATGGQAQHNATCRRFVVVNGLSYVYLCQSSKCIYIYKKEDDVATAKAYTRQGLTTSFSCGQAYLGGQIGSQCLNATWLKDKVLV